MNTNPENDNAGRQPGTVGKTENQHLNDIKPTPTGQCGFILDVVRRNPGIKSLTITADLAVPECAARVHDLRAAGWNIITTIHPVVVFRGLERRKVASYSLGTPEWKSPEFRLPENVPVQAEMSFGGEACEVAP